MEFGDIKTASRMRSIMERVALGVINRERPDVRIGLVHHYDTGLQFAWVKFPGEDEDSLVKVRIALDQTPTKDIIGYGESGCDVVRVAGKPGGYWIMDFVKGLPQSPHLKPGSLVRYGGVGVPDGYLLANGGEASQALYPALYTAYGNKYGTASAGNFRLPLFHKIYDDVDPITTGLFTANAGWAIDSQNLRIRNSMVYLQVVFHATAAQTFTNVDHADQDALAPTLSMLAYYGPDVQAIAVAANNVRHFVLQTDCHIMIKSGVVSSGGSLNGNIALNESFTVTFFYPMPDDVTGLNGEVMLVKT